MATPSLLYASGTWTMKGKMKKKVQKILPKIHRCARRARREPPRSRRRRSTRPRQGAGGRYDRGQPTRTPKSKQKATWTPTASDSVPNDEPEDELEPRVDYMVPATHKADDPLAANGITSRILRESRMYWNQARTIAKHHEGRWTKLLSNWNPAISTKLKGYQKQGRPAKRWEEHINANLQPTRVTRNDSDLTSDTTWLTAAQDGLTWESMESHLIFSIRMQPARPRPSLRLRQANHTIRTNNAHDQSPRTRRRRR